VYRNARPIERILTLLSREHAQTKPDGTVMLSVISGTSVLAFTRLSENALTAASGLVRLIF
jgi:hypothetical protein